MLAHHLGEGYFAASGLPADDDAAAAFLADLAQRLGARSRSGVVLLMNGFDHAPPEATTARAAVALARRTGDPSLDIGDEARAWALEAIESAGGATSWSRMVREVSIMERADEVRAMGDTLPFGLAL